MWYRYDVELFRADTRFYRLFILIDIGIIG